MEMIWLNGKFLCGPTFFFTLGFNDLATILCDLIHKNRLAAFRCPYKVQQEKMYPVFIPLKNYVILLEEARRWRP